MVFRKLSGNAGGNPHSRFGTRGLGIALTAHYKRLLAHRQNAFWLGILMSCLLLAVLPVRAQGDVTVTDAGGNDVTITDTVLTP
jgi:hypothetical protein